MSWLWISLGLSIVLPQMLELYEQVLPFPYPSLKDLDIEMVSTSSISAGKTRSKISTFQTYVFTTQKGNYFTPPSESVKF